MTKEEFKSAENVIQGIIALREELAIATTQRNGFQSQLLEMRKLYASSQEEVKRLKEEKGEMLGRWSHQKAVIASQDEYIQLLTDTYNETLSVAATRSYYTPRYEHIVKGKELRDKIEKFKKGINPHNMEESKVDKINEYRTKLSEIKRLVIEKEELAKSMKYQEAADVREIHRKLERELPSYDGLLNEYESKVLELEERVKDLTGLGLDYANQIYDYKKQISELTELVKEAWKAGGDEAMDFHYHCERCTPLMAMTQEEWLKSKGIKE